MTDGSVVIREDDDEGRGMAVVSMADWKKKRESKPLPKLGIAGKKPPRARPGSDLVCPDCGYQAKSHTELHVCTDLQDGSSTQSGRLVCPSCGNFFGDLTILEGLVKVTPFGIAIDLPYGVIRDIVNDFIMPSGCHFNLGWAILNEFKSYIKEHAPDLQQPLYGDGDEIKEEIEEEPPF
jgi:rubredoxin